MAEPPHDGGPAVILVRPQLGVNIGSCARAMLNCGLHDLRLVAPREGWPNPHALPAASGADAVLDAVRVYRSLEEAVADLQRVYATTYRPRELVKPIVTPRQAAAELRALEREGQRCGVLFGPERTGLTSDELAYADAILTAPLNPAFASLNLAQAVLLVAYEWWIAADATPPSRLHLGNSPPVEKRVYLHFMGQLEAALEEDGFFTPPEKKPHMLRNLHALFTRAEMTDQEVRTLYGAVKALREPKGRKRGPDGP